MRGAFLRGNKTLLAQYCFKYKATNKHTICGELKANRLLSIESNAYIVCFQGFTILISSISFRLQNCPICIAIKCRT
jgi:hypothetical protein